MKKRVGVIGTFIWDVINGRPPHGTTISEWGGITYALSGFEAALSDNWEIVLITKVGQDLAHQANDFTRTLTKLAPDTAPIAVPDPTTRVTINYITADQRKEYLTGGMTGWTWLGLKPLLKDLDALYINLISGFELDLETAQLIRQNFKGPIYCDLHSLLLMRHPDGLRTLQPLPNVAGWCACFDIIQVNEDEMRMMAPDSMALAATAIANGVSNLIVTVGPKGAIYFTAQGFNSLPDLPNSSSTTTTLPRAAALTGTIRTALVSPPMMGEEGVEGLLPRRNEREHGKRPSTPSSGRPGQGDPTGCGDVFGSTYFATLLAGGNFEASLKAALSAATRNVYHRGTTGLATYLRGSLNK